MRPLLIFFVLGAVLYGAKRALPHVGAGRTRLIVSVARDAAQSEIEAAIDESVLLNRALSRGMILVDPVVREELLRTMRGLEPLSGSASDAVLLERALALDVHRRDPLIRKRLAFQSYQTLRASLEMPTASDQAYEQYLREHAERYRVAARASFSQVFVSRSLHGSDLEHAAKERLARLVADSVTSEQAHLVSDPSVLAWQFRNESARDLDRKFGPGWGDYVQSCPMGGWQGPVSSSYGLHFVWVHARSVARLPSLADVRPRLIADYQHDTREQVLRTQLRVLRDGFEVVVQRSAQ